MVSAAHLRILGYAVTLVIHSYTLYDVVARLAITTRDPIVADFATLQDKFITIWTFMCQIGYVILGLSCELFHLKSLLGLRQTLFSAIVWPFSTWVPSMFWPLYLYDAGLVFPPYIDKILSWWNNQVMHTYVAFFVFWELIFLERRGENHKLYLKLLSSYIVVYLLVLFKSFVERGAFIYPILTILYGTIFFYIFLTILISHLFLCYYLQWPLNDVVWGTEKKLAEKNR